MQRFIETKPKDETLWRAIILFGRNVASYKFALGKTLLELASKEKTFVKIDELAEPFSRNVCEHLAITSKQGTFKGSRFLAACKGFNDGQIKRDELIAKTVSLGFNNVIDAFHIVNRGEIPKRFFTDERKARNGIQITDDLLALKERLQFVNLPLEVEARWRLVETAWSLNLNPRLLEIKVDASRQILFVENDLARRMDVTSCRDSLNGYQKGKCFYCLKEIIIEGHEQDRAMDVDHFFPHMLVHDLPEINIDGVWNLVLSCRECNRGEKGKSSRIPELHFLGRLYDRNEYLIWSHHPLRETLMKQTGDSPEERRKTLQRIDSMAIERLVHRWKPRFQHDFTF